MSAIAPTRTAPIALWRIAQGFLHILYNLFGAPEDVAFRHTLTRGPYALLLSWLRVGEAMMRRLIAIEAAAFPKPNTRPLLHASRTRKRRAIGFECDKPEEWRVCFRCLQSSPLRQAQRRAGGCASGQESATLSLSKGARRAGPPTFYSAWPLAERYEALIRVFNDPAPYARRLAHRLHARPHLISAVLAAPAEYEHRVDSSAEFTTAAKHAWPCRHDTS